MAAPPTIIVEYSSEVSEDTDLLSLVADQWKKIGIKLLTKPQSLNNFRMRAFSGEATMTAYAGVVTAVPLGRDVAQGILPDHARRPAVAAVGHVHRIEGQAG